MFKTIHSTLSEVCCDHFRQLRRKAGITQRDLALALRREHSLVSRIEDGERQIDLVEAFELFKALGANPEKEAAILMAKFARADDETSKS